MDFSELVEKQLTIQNTTYGIDFTRMTHEERTGYIKNMVLAATHELHEALDSVGWKDWSTSEHFFLEKYLDELADVQLLLINLVLAVGWTPEQASYTFFMKALQKQKLNVQRQESGY